MMRLFAVLCLALGIALLGACQPADATRFNGDNITGVGYGRDFHLTDHTGQSRSLADYREQVVALFFGYTQCPDVCPVTLVTMNDVMQLLGADADKVQVLFITVDPERDTQQLLAQYVPFFNERFAGLYGDVSTTRAVAKEFRIFYQKSGDTSGGFYSVDHSSGTYLFDRSGKIRVHEPYGLSAEKIAEDIRLLLAEN